MVRLQICGPASLSKCLPEYWALVERMIRVSAETKEKLEALKKARHAVSLDAVILDLLEQQGGSGSDGERVLDYGEVRVMEDDDDDDNVPVPQLFSCDSFLLVPNAVKYWTGLYLQVFAWVVATIEEAVRRVCVCLACLPLVLLGVVRRFVFMDAS